jgi:hypothetical protein
MQGERRTGMQKPQDTTHRTHDDRGFVLMMKRLTLAELKFVINLAGYKNLA